MSCPPAAPTPSDETFLPVGRGERLPRSVQ
jgi:hypothetical protein